MENLDPQQMILIGIVASLVAQGVKIFAAWTGIEVGRKGMTVTVFVAAVALAYIFARPAVPPFPAPVEDPAAYAALVTAWIVALVQMAAGILGTSFALYNLLLEKVFDKISFGKIKKLEFLTAKSPQNPEAGL